MSKEFVPGTFAREDELVVNLKPRDVWVGESGIDRSQPAMVFNTRTLTAPLSGVQRYVREMRAFLGDRLTAISPARPMHGMLGHMWEQARLPGMLDGGLLWSPANSGPVLVERQVVTVHDVACLDHPEWFNRYFAAWYRWMLPLLVRRVRHVIAVSEFTKRRLVETTGVMETRVSVVPNGVDKRFRSCLPADIERVRHQLRIPTAHYLLSLGTREPRKNIRGQLEAWTRCVGKVPESVWLVVCGANGNSRVFGDVSIGEMPPRVHFVGFVADERLPALYSGAIAVLYPSIYEGFGLPALEAMAAATVPIVSDWGALPEVVGEAGILVDPADPAAIAEAIVGVVGNRQLRMELGAIAAERSKLFTWKRASQMTWQVLEEAAGLSGQCESTDLKRTLS